MAGVVAAQDLRVELRPGLRPFGLLLAQRREGVTCGPNADNRLACRDELAEDGHARGRQQAAAHADQGEVGLVEYFEARKIIADLLVGVDLAHPEGLAEVGQGEGWESALGLILVLAQDED